ncbi:hypothetical protein [Thiothrix eikelboomii]|uniref:Uncharacterized protein n=1 Tax=Thiothrix eikelboomii TaxID=92487 RepID=A0A1T4W8D6_9GAMM|nr:hypothetical protein [Thiothrix eikelboomii]SKA73540.1 hypothetical protein SAMN02745130_01242 [Thiothrix eikelboomii]
MQHFNQEETQQRPLCYTHKSTCYLEEHSPQVGSTDSLPLVYTCTLKFNTRKQQAGKLAANPQQQG